MAITEKKKTKCRISDAVIRLFVFIYDGNTAKTKIPPALIIGVLIS
jgi:hypothetical protein